MEDKAKLALKKKTLKGKRPVHAPTLALKKSVAGARGLFDS